MLDKLFINSVLVQIKNELRHQEDFITNLKNVNIELDSKGSQPLYSLHQLINMGEQYIQSIRRATAELPLEEQID